MSMKLYGTLFKVEACLYNTMRAFEFFKLKINKLPRLSEVARKLKVYSIITSSFSKRLQCSFDKKKQLKMSTLKDILSLFGTYV